MRWLLCLGPLALPHLLERLGKTWAARPTWEPTLMTGLVLVTGKAFKDRPAAESASVGVLSRDQGLSGHPPVLRDPSSPAAQWSFTGLGTARAELPGKIWRLQG